MGEASMYDCIFLILLFYMYICILYVDILSNKSIYLHIYNRISDVMVNVHAASEVYRRFEPPVKPKKRK